MLESLLAILAVVLDLLGFAGESTRRRCQLREALNPIVNKLVMVIATVPLALAEVERNQLKNEVDSLNELMVSMKRTGKVPSHAEIHELIQSLQLFIEQPPSYSNTFSVLSSARKASQSLA